jgi:hypothetical protein
VINTITCNVCGREFKHEMDPALYLDSAAEIAEYQAEWLAEYGWVLRPDGYALCPDDDRSHASARESLTTQPPAPQIPGRTELATETGT